MKNKKKSSEISYIINLDKGAIEAINDVVAGFTKVGEIIQKKVPTGKKQEIIEHFATACDGFANVAIQTLANSYSVKKKNG